MSAARRRTKLPCLPGTCPSLDSAADAEALTALELGAAAADGTKVDLRGRGSGRGVLRRRRGQGRVLRRHDGPGLVGRRDGGAAAPAESTARLMLRVKDGQCPALEPRTINGTGPFRKERL